MHVAVRLDHAIGGRHERLVLDVNIVVGVVRSAKTHKGFRAFMTAVDVMWTGQPKGPINPPK